MRVRSLLIGAAALLAALVVAAPAAAAPTAEIAPDAKRLKGGKFAAVAVTVTCGSGETVLEAFVYLVQNGNQSPFAPIRDVVCDGTAHVYVVTVAAPTGERFRRGEARASGYVLTNQGSTSPARTVTIR